MVSVMDYIFRLLSFRERSEWELKDRMKHAGYEDDEVMRALQKIKEMGYLDDNRFAKLYVESKRLKGDGKYRLRSGLKEKGIDEETIKLVLSPISDDEEIMQACLLLKRKIKNKEEEFIQRKDFNKVHRFLLRKGYSYFIASKALKKFFKDSYMDEVPQ